MASIISCLEKLNLMEQMTLSKEEANAIRELRKYGIVLTKQRVYLLEICENIRRSDDTKRVASFAMEKVV